MEESRALADLLDARRRLKGRHSQSAGWFARSSVARQASSELTAQWRAKRFPAGAEVADLCSGAGVDAVALADRCDVIAVESDATSAFFVRTNLERFASRRHLVVEGRAPAASPRTPFCFADPDRRIDGRRVVEPDQASPSLTALLESSCGFEGRGVKLSPMVDTEQLEGMGELEFLSVGRELKEVVLWTGSLARGSRSVSLPGQGFVLEGAPQPISRLDSPGEWLFSPDPALVRSGLLGMLGEELGLWGMEPGVAYLSANALCSHPLLKSYRVLEVFPNRIKDIRRFLKQNGLGRVTAGRRRFAESPDKFLKRLGRLKGESTAHLILTTCSGEPRVFVTQASEPKDRPKHP